MYLLYCRLDFIVLCIPLSLSLNKFVEYVLGFKLFNIEKALNLSTEDIVSLLYLFLNSKSYGVTSYLDAKHRSS